MSDTKPISNLEYLTKQGYEITFAYSGSYFYILAIKDDEKMGSTGDSMMEAVERLTKLIKAA